MKTQASMLYLSDAVIRDLIKQDAEAPNARLTQTDRDILRIVGVGAILLAIVLIVAALG